MQLAAVISGVLRENWIPLASRYGSIASAMRFMKYSSLPAPVIYGLYSCVLGLRYTVGMVIAPLSGGFPILCRRARGCNPRGAFLCHKKKTADCARQSVVLVRVVGVEPTRIASQEPKSCASANSAIPAYSIFRHTCGTFYCTTGMAESQACFLSSATSRPGRGRANRRTTCGCSRGRTCRPLGRCSPARRRRR